MDRILSVYKALGRILNNPQSFGLGDRLPKALTEVLCAMRQCLREELAEQNELSSRDWLSCELSQDADSRHPTNVGSVAKP